MSLAHQPMGSLKTAHKSLFRSSDTRIGEYFSGALAAADLDGDGLDELLVGSPLASVRQVKVQFYILRQKAREAKRRSQEKFIETLTASMNFSLDPLLHPSDMFNTILYVMRQKASQDEKCQTGSILVSSKVPQLTLEYIGKPD